MHLGCNQTLAIKPNADDWSKTAKKLIDGERLNDHDNLIIMTARTIFLSLFIHLDDLEDSELKKFVEDILNAKDFILVWELERLCYTFIALFILNFAKNGITEKIQQFLAKRGDTSDGTVDSPA